MNDQAAPKGVDPAAMALARAAADGYLVVSSQADLGRAAKAWRRAPLLAVDTEFVRVDTYHAKLGLVQVSDGQSAWLVDNLAIEDLTPLADMLQSPDTLKLLHAPSEDLEVLLHTLDVLPEPFVDTQVAAALLGQAHQLGYHGLIEWRLGITLEKGATRSDWTRRPLSEKQLHYAAEDVAYLPLAWTGMQQQLQALGREDWLREDSAAQLDKARSEIAPDDLYLRHRQAMHMESTQLSVLQALCAWRELEARRRNKPRTFIVKDPALAELARRQPDNDSQLTSIEGIGPGIRRRYGDKLISLVQQAAQQDQPPPAPPGKLSPEQNRLVKKMQNAVAEKAEALGVVATLLLPRRELEHLVRLDADEIPGAIRGWRGELLAEPVRALLEESS